VRSTCDRGDAADAWDGRDHRDSVGLGVSALSEPLTITVSPVFDREDDPLCGGSKRQMFEVRRDGRLVARSATPLRDACRRLLRDGIDPSAEVVTRQEGDSTGAELRTTLRAGAELSPMGKVA
jgi:hypothetical protein